MTKMDEVRKKLVAETSSDLLLAFCENVSDDEIRHVIRAYAAEAEIYAGNCWCDVHNAIDELVSRIDTLNEIPGDGAAYLRKIRAADQDAREALDEAIKAEEEYQRIKRMFLAEVDDDEAD